MAPRFPFFFFFPSNQTGPLTAWFLCQLGNCHIKSSHFRDSRVTDPLNNQDYSVRGTPKKFVLRFSVQRSLLSLGYFGFQKGLGLLPEGLRLVTKANCLRATSHWDQRWCQSWTSSLRELQLETQHQGSSFPNPELKNPISVMWWDSKFLNNKSETVLTKS